MSFKDFKSLAGGGGVRSELRVSVSSLASVLVPGHEVHLAEHGSAGLGRVAAAGSTEVKGCWAESWSVERKRPKNNEEKPEDPRGNKSSRDCHHYRR